MSSPSDESVSSAALPSAARSAEHLHDRPGAFVSALLTEQFVLQSVRGNTVSESSSRAGLYLATLSSALVGFGFLAATPFAVGYLAAIIPVIVILGVFTYERLVQTSLEDVAALAAIQRIRHYYRGLLPGAEVFFPMPPSPRAPNELLDIGQKGSWRGVFFTVSSSIAVVNSIMSGIGVTVLLLSGGWSVSAAALAGTGVAVVLALLHGLYQERRYRRLTSLLHSQHRGVSASPGSAEGGQAIDGH